MPGSWSNVCIGDICSVRRGSSPRPIKDERYFRGGTIPWIKIADATSSDKYIYETRQKVNEFGASFSRLLPAGSLILAASGTLGCVKLLGVQGCIHDGWLHLYDFKGVDSQFLYYWLSLNAEQLSNGAAYGAAIQNINTELLRSFEISLPPFEVQLRISSLLSAYDDLIENNTRRIEILEEMARRLYEEWFVQFRFPGHEGVEFKESELGLAPKGWSPATVKSLVLRLKGGKAYKSEELQGDGSIIVVDQSRAEYLGFHDNEPSYLASPKTPAIIFGDHTCKMQVMVTPFSVGPNTVVFAGQKGHSPYYIYSLVRGLVSTAEYKRHWSDLTGKIVLEAPATLSTSYGEMVSPMFGEIELLRRKNRNLRAQRDLLLPKLISGEIDVSDIPMPT